MTDSEINVAELISDKQLEQLGYTRETFKGSNTEALLEAMLLSFEDTVQEETKKLMKTNSLTYVEARNISFKNVFNAVAIGLKGGYDNGDKK